MFAEKFSQFITLLDLPDAGNLFDADLFCLCLARKEENLATSCRIRIQGPKGSPSSNSLSSDI